MGEHNSLFAVGLVLIFPFVFYFLKVWLFATGTPGSTHHRVRRIADLDGHLSFEERLAEKLRAESEAAPSLDPLPPEPDTPAPAPVASSPITPKGFGRRGL